MALRTKNISEKAYAHIRESLLVSGAYVGQKIPHQELGQKLGISHTPVREALFRLVAEGLLEHRNYRGFSVPAITLAEAGEIYEARLVIEPYLAKKAAELMTPARLKNFHSILETYKRLMTEHYNRKRILTDKKFHMEIAALAGNQTLLQVLNQIYDKLIFKSPVERIAPTRTEEAIKEHYDILKMLEAGNGKGAALRMTKHIEQQRDYVIDNIETKESGRQDINPLPRLKGS